MVKWLFITKLSVGEETDYGYNSKVRAGNGKTGGPVTTLGTVKENCAGYKGGDATYENSHEHNRQ